MPRRVIAAERHQPPKPPWPTNPRNPGCRHGLRTLRAVRPNPPLAPNQPPRDKPRQQPLDPLQSRREPVMRRMRRPGLQKPPLMHTPQHRLHRPDHPGQVRKQRRKQGRGEGRFHTYTNARYHGSRKQIRLWPQSVKWRPFRTAPHSPGNPQLHPTAQPDLTIPAQAKTPGPSASTAHTASPLAAHRGNTPMPSASKTACASTPASPPTPDQDNPTPAA